MAGRNLFDGSKRTKGRDLFSTIETELDIAPYLTIEEKKQAESGESGRMPFMELLTGKERQTELTKTLPEFRETPPIQTAELGAKGTKMAIGILSTFDPEGQVNVIKEAIPNAKFFVDEKDNIIIDVDGKQSVLNKPGFSKQDAVQALTSILTFAPAAKLAGLGSTVMKKLGIGALASAGTEQAVQETSIAAGSEVPRDPVKTAVSGALGGLTEIIGPTRQFLRQRKAAKALGKAGEGVTDVTQNVAKSREAVEAVEKLTGEQVPIYQAQQTLIPSELNLQRILPQLDASSQLAAQRLGKQSNKIKSAVDKAIETISPREVIDAPERLRTAAQKAIDVKNAVRKEASSPFFDAAKKEIVDVAYVVKTIDNELKPFLGASNIKNQLNKIKSNILPKEGNPTIEQLQKAKAVIDETLSSTGETAVKGDARRIVKNVKESLLTAMDGAGAASKEEAKSIREKVKSLMDDVIAGKEVADDQIASLPQYAQGRIRFAQNSPEVTALLDGRIGKIADLDDIQIENMSNSIFNPRLRPETIKDTKQVIESIDPDAWQDILKFKMIDNMSNMKVSKAGEVQNVAGNIRRSLFGNERSKKALFAGMSPEQKKNFRYLDDVLSRAESGRGAGSPTASFTEIIKNMKSVPLLMQKLFTINVSELQKAGKDTLLNRRIKAISNAAFDDTWADQMRKIRNMNPDSKAAAKAMAQLLKSVEEASRDNTNTK